MNLRKFLNIQNNELKTHLQYDIDNILMRCEEIACVEYKDQREAQQSHDNNCPNCHARKDKIVNKISLMQGKTTIVEASSFLSKKITTTTITDTIEVNYCTACQNEWKKFKTKYISKTDILRVALMYLASILDNPEEKKHEWKMETIKVFQDCSIESILKLTKQNEKFLNKNTLSALKYSKLNQYYNSVFE